MAGELSARLAAVVDALPLMPGMRVLEIGCGPGAAAREVARRLGAGGFVLATDRSERAVALAAAACAGEIGAGLMAVRRAAAHELARPAGAPPFDLAFAVRVGAFDGRHPDAFGPAMAGVRAMLAPHGRFFIDGGDPLRELPLR